MAIDQRQVSDLSLLRTKFKMGTIMEGDEVNVILSHDAASNTYKMDFVFPSHVMNPPTDPEPTDPNPPEPTDPEPSDEPVDPPENKPIEECTVEEMLEIIKAGKASEYWSIGDKVHIGHIGNFTCSNNISDTFVQGDIDLYGIILGFDHNIDYEHPTKQHTVTIGAFIHNGSVFSIYGFGTPMASIEDAIAGFDTSFYSVLPFEWQNAITKPIIKATGGTNPKTYPTGVFNLSYGEVNGARADFIVDGYVKNYDNQKQYDYFKIANLTTKIGWKKQYSSSVKVGMLQSPLAVYARDELPNSSEYCLALNANGKNAKLTTFVTNNLSPLTAQTNELGTKFNANEASINYDNSTSRVGCLYWKKTTPTLKYVVKKWKRSGENTYLYDRLVTEPASHSVKTKFMNEFGITFDRYKPGYSDSSFQSMELPYYLSSGILFLPCFDIG